MMGSQGGAQHPHTPHHGFKELASLWHEDSSRLLPAFKEARPRSGEETSDAFPLESVGVSLSLPLMGEGRW